jgi:alpha-beta hydrolase superfamily lysophospholipase
MTPHVRVATDRVGGAGRQIETQIYYPSSASADGDSTAFASGQYPVLIFGHGFLMVYSAYDNIWKDLVPQGYIICFPETEGSASPSHTDFGKDLALLQSKMMGLNSTAASPFYNTMTNKVAIMGHSMGGGSSFLACAGNSAPTTMVTEAAANTNPSSIVAATQVTIPTLLLAGQNDCVAPPPANQDSMYLKCAASCKAEVTIKGAAHCEFADKNTYCTFGESICSPAPTISAAQQWATASVYYSAWLKYWLKGDCTAWNTFLDSVNKSTLITGKISCSQTCSPTSVLNAVNKSGIEIYPTPTNGSFNVSFTTIAGEKAELDIFDVFGQQVYHSGIEQGINRLSLDGKASGIYFYRVMTQDGGKYISEGKLMLQK